MPLRVRWQSIALKQPMYERVCDSLFLGDGGSKTVAKEKDMRKGFVSKHHKLTAIYCPTKNRNRKRVLANLPKCLERQNLTALMVDAIICIFSKFTRPSMEVLLPSCANVMSFSSNGMNGITGGCNLPTDILLCYAATKWVEVSTKWKANSRGMKGGKNFLVSKFCHRILIKTRESFARRVLAPGLNVTVQCFTYL